ncbi:O-antigen/teichoic acid export membrane protein [Hoeflea marina]|uniref:O-antigen/teichoic acid export membrane protein n=1 Tax=Hoeflea marina TaxID=274592 RepID=A0A317PKR6_9HYPH|nr:oligosaccharide flippase family protein [Hoeflea marina]PWV99189.1 O-antigen/teichoic acid export membrane protein [Hoeflea marina]
MKPADSGIVRNSALNAGAGLTLLIAGFVSSVVVARLLGPGASGTIAFSLWLVTTGTLIAELGTGVSLLRLLPQLAARGHDLAARRRFAAYLAWPVVFSTTVFTLGYAVVAALSDRSQWHDLPSEIVVVTGVLFFVQSIGSYSKNYLIGEQRLGGFMKLSLASAAMQLACVTLGAWHFGVPGALAGYACGQFILFVATVSILRSRPDNCGLSMRQVASSSLVVIIEYIVAAVFLARPEIVFLQYFRDAETVGLYAVALSLANLALQLPIQLTGSLLPYYSGHLERNGGLLPGGVFETVVRNFAYLTLPISFGLAAVAEPLVTSIYGAAFREAGIFVAILAVAAPASVFLQLCTQYVFSIDRPGIRLMTALFGAISMVLGLLLIVPAYGGEGAAAVRGLVLVGMCVYIVRFTRLSASSASLVPSLARITLAAVLCAVSAWLVTGVVDGLPGVLLAVLGGIAVYLAGLRVLGAVSRDDRASLHAIGAKVPAKARPFYLSVVTLVAARAGDGGL